MKKNIHFMMIFVFIASLLFFTGCGNSSTSGDEDVMPKETVTFGSWPQTVKSENVTITEESKTCGMFTYYKGSDGEWYAKIEVPFYQSCTFSDGSSAESGEEKYFKVEPVKWVILTNNYNGKKLLLADKILIAKSFDDNGSNYRDSKIRSWLNGDFFQTAFSAEEQNRIVTTVVDNSARSTNPADNPTKWNDGKNDCATENTNDKVFLLSEEEVTTRAYGFDADPDACKGDGIHSESSRIRFLTDFANASGADGGFVADLGGFWWLRSSLPNYIEGRSIPCYVQHNGAADCHEAYVELMSECFGVVPALCIE